MNRPALVELLALVLGAGMIGALGFVLYVGWWVR